jgi:DegV family protein with EDD domain
MWLKMDRAYCSAFVFGYERMAAWSDLLDQINVFPVPDADTGRNLKISLAALHQLYTQPTVVPHQILRTATGNAGNIAAAFIHELLKIDAPSTLADAIQTGTRMAHMVVAEPKPGTMLTLFEVLAQAVPPGMKPTCEWDLDMIIGQLEKCVDDTTGMLPELKHAGVVDAGALGMFIFLEAFLDHVSGRMSHSRPVTERFNGKLHIASGWQPHARQPEHCVSAVIRPQGDREERRRRLSGWGSCVVVNETADYLKVHLHTDNHNALRAGLSEIGQVLDYSEEKIELARSSADQSCQPVHIMTDAAGSVTLDDAQALGMTLLDSYLVVDDQSYPETLYSPAALYSAMAGGHKVSTAQASVYQRHQSYLSAVSRFERVLYLCVGSAYTGNFEAARSWQAAHDNKDRLTILDTGAASGRLGIVALATARYARQRQEPEAVLRFAQQAIRQSQELVFLDQLKYLAAGGRISKTSGFFGDLLHLKPIITPSPQGAVKVGVVRTREGQLTFALKRLERCFNRSEAPLILLQYSENQDWVEKVAAVELRSLLPAARILFRPLSLTSGAHMGPGTWAVAFLPSAFNQEQHP